MDDHQFKKEDRLLILREAGIGALFLGKTTPFALTRPDNEVLGLIRSSGFYLREDGTPGALQQIDPTA
ncbi:MAG: hypothetical protein H5T73_10820 [Actinobacteria bacterium]|nr:hypothetical protein [Actinomycetota bacterium]